MEVIHIDHHSIPDHLDPSVCCIGYFDGLHIGHQELLKKSKALSGSMGLKSGLITFDPDPWRIFYPDRICRHITSLQDRISIIESMGIDIVYVLSFTFDFASLDVSHFHLLLNQMHVKHLVCGFDFKYASKNSGNVDTLSKQHDFGITVIDSVNASNSKISSSRIEPCILSGKLDVANDLLGYMYSVSGVIVHGFKRGSSLLKIPTANLDVDLEYLIPSNGVYAGFVSIDSTLYGAMINVGNNPTFENAQITIEAHIFDFDQDIYDKKVRFFFLKKTRNDIKFKDFNALKTQLFSDIDICKNEIKKHRNLVFNTAQIWVLSLDKSLL